MCQRYRIRLKCRSRFEFNQPEYLSDNIPWIDEVSIGHALISDALYYGLEETIKKYKDQLK